MTTTALSDGLLLRTATPGDRSQIEELLVVRGEAGDDLDHRLVVDDPDAGWEACAVVVDGDRVVSTATLLDETIALGEVTLPAGQVELVATDRAYEGVTGGAEQYYARLADTEGVLRAVQPVLERRLATSDLEADDVVISTFGRHYRWSVASDGAWGPLQTGGPMQAPGSARAVGVAPDALPALLFGPRGLAGLTAIRPDVYAGDATPLYDALFPPVTADLLTYYLPY